MPRRSNHTRSNLKTIPKHVDVFTKTHHEKRIPTQRKERTWQAFVFTIKPEQTTKENICIWQKSFPQTMATQLRPNKYCQRGHEVHQKVKSSQCWHMAVGSEFLEHVIANRELPLIPIANIPPAIWLCEFPTYFQSICIECNPWPNC